MKLLIVIILLLIAHLQFRLWAGSDSFAQIEIAKQQLADLQKQVDLKKQRNDTLYAEVENLRKGQEAIEERARNELGMIKENETFFQVIEK
ncbi:MAG: cell division protein FtsB [Methylovulum sp.]|jgi:cell division protein FtsB|nr:cell division protein FtsB [Methylovulum sp.]TSA37685.1 MAG: cell division protein FtsB [Methylococcaceae bacterium]